MSKRCPEADPWSCPNCGRRADHRTGTGCQVARGCATLLWVLVALIVLVGIHGT